MSEPSLCSKHFIEYFESKVAKTIKDHKLLEQDDRIVVATSGGKDSLTLLYILNKNYNNVEALIIDEGIKGYREKTLNDLIEFCRQHKIKLNVASFKKEFGKSLDEMMKKAEHPCTVCGILRRYLLNKNSRSFDKIGLAHNLDDEAQSILMNLLKNNVEISARLGPFVGIIRDKKFTLRVKPLYFCTEKEVMTYAYLKGFQLSYNVCPYANESFRNLIRDELNGFEEKHPGTKANIVKSFIKDLPKLKRRFHTDEKLQHCIRCGEPTHQDVCNACKTIDKIRK